MTDRTDNFFGRIWWVLVVFGAIAILFGLMAVLRPLNAAFALTWAIGIVAFAEGIVGLIALIRHNYLTSSGWQWLYCIASILFGVLAILNPELTAGVLLIFLAVWLIIGGLFRIIFAIRVRKQIQQEWLIGLSGLLSLILGILFIASPLTGLAVTLLWIGIGALLYGVLQVIAGFRLRQWGQQLTL